MPDGVVEVSSVDHRHASRPDLIGGVEHWTEQDKEMALAIYAECASTATASRETGIPKSTIERWLTAEGVDETLDRLRLAVRHSVAHKLAMAAQLSINGLIDRIQYGDWKMHPRSGQLTRVPMSGKDLTFTHSVCVDKHALITGAMQRTQGANAQLQSIAERLLAAMQASAEASAPPKPPVDDGPVLG